MQDMEILYPLMNRVLIYHIVFILTSLAAIPLCVAASRKRDAFAMIAIALGIVLISHCIGSFVPFLKDYRTGGITEAEAVYTNPLKDKSGSASDAIGMYSVVLDVEGERISLTTVPYSKELFPQGQYPVRAWYTVNSGWLLYTDIQLKTLSRRI